MFAAAGEMEQSDNSSLSTWMSHWTRRRSGEVVRSFDQSAIIFEKKENGHDTSRHQPTSKLDIAVPNVSSPTEGLKINGSRNRYLENDSLRNEHQWCPFYKDSHGKILGTGKALKRNRAAFDGESLQHQVNHYFGNDSAGGLHSNLKVTNARIKTPTLFGDGCSRPVEDSHHVHSDFDNGYGRIPLFPSLRDNEDSHHAQSDPSTSNNWSLGISENSQKTRSFSGLRLVHDWSKLPEKNNFEMLDHRFNRLSRFQSSINQVETAGICSTVDSVGVSGGHSRFPRTTHSSLISEKTLLKADQAYENSRGRADKVIKLNSMTPRLDLCLGGVEDGARLVKTKRPDINLEFPTSSTEENMVAFEEPSTSITRSMYMETIAAHAKQSSPSGSDNIQCGSVKPEPSARWIKRLKLNGSRSYSVSAKSSNSGEGLPHEKISLERISNGCVGSSESAANMTHSRELRLLNKTTTLKPCGKSFFAVSTKKDGELLSDSWVKRWCHHKDANPEKNPDVEVVSEPKSWSLLLENTEKKQFPSIDAMALMAKAMNGFQPCDIQNTGAYAVWNTRQLK